MSKTLYDVVIIGSGASGMTAGIYAHRAGLRALIVEKALAGGQMLNTKEIENFPSYESITGFELSDKMFRQVFNLGIEVLTGEVINVIDGFTKTLTIDVFGERVEVLAKTVIIATGTSHRELPALQGKETSVSYCAVCDGAFYKDKEVVVVGGGNTALEDALYLSQIASKVTVIHRKDKFTADVVNQYRVVAKENIEVIWNSTVIDGDSKSVRIQNNVTGLVEDILCSGVFVCIGNIPNTQQFSNLGILGQDGFILTDDFLQTAVRGIFAIGDVRNKSVRQIVTAVGDGSVAVKYVNEYIRQLDESGIS